MICKQGINAPNCKVGMKVNIKGLTDSRDTVNKWMERFGVRFGVYKKGTFKEQLFPFDSVPRIIPKKDWDYLETGLQQRVKALNMFLWDIYHDKKIIKDGIVPEEFVYSSKGYMLQCCLSLPSASRCLMTLRFSTTTGRFGAARRFRFMPGRPTMWRIVPACRAWRPEHAILYRIIKEEEN